MQACTHQGIRRQWSTHSVASVLLFLLIRFLFFHPFISIVHTHSSSSSSMCTACSIFLSVCLRVICFRDRIIRFRETQHLLTKNTPNPTLRKSWDSGAPNRHSCITKSTNRNATTNWNSILSSLGELASQIECAATPTCW